MKFPNDSAPEVRRSPSCATARPPVGRTRTTAFRRVARAVAIVCLAAVAAHAQDGGAPEPEAPQDLKSALESYDRRDPGEFTNTIPVEKAALAAGEAGRIDDLVAASAHDRFGDLAFAVLCEGAKAPPDAKVLPVWNAYTVERRAGTALTVAALRTEPVRAALRAFAALPEVSGDAGMAGSATTALVRAGDPAAVKAVRDGLASKDVAVVVAALLRAGDARAWPEFLRDAARLADDARKLAEPVNSAWSDEKRETSADGLTTTMTQVPVTLATVGEVAVEAANRMFASPLPGYVAWWYEPEKGPRFGRGAAAVTLLRATVAADEKAVKAKAMGFAAAAAAVVRAVRTGGEDMRTLRITGVAFDKVWTFRHELDGTAGTATVGPDGKAALR